MCAIIVFTIGRYFWRGARTRGFNDRFGRLLIIGGYVLLGIGLDGAVHSAVELWSARSEDSAKAVVLDVLITTALWGVPGAILAAIGFKLANEVALAEAKVEGGF